MAHELSVGLGYEKLLINFHFLLLRPIWTAIPAQISGRKRMMSCGGEGIQVDAAFGIR